jgi:hypothetical protein
MKENHISDRKLGTDEPQLLTSEAIYPLVTHKGRSAVKILDKSYRKPWRLDVGTHFSMLQHGWRGGQHRRSIAL